MGLAKTFRCTLAGTIIYFIISLFLLSFSFECVTHIQTYLQDNKEVWSAPAYWLAWASGFSLFGSAVSAFVGGIFLSLTLDCS